MKLDILLLFYKHKNSCGTQPIKKELIAMWKFILIASLSLFPVLSYITPQISTEIFQDNVPPYAKWGQVAMQVTKEKYPDAEIIDYLHIGAVDNNGTTTERFKLWLRGDTREFGVFIDIHFKTETEEVIEINFQETDR